MGKQRKIKTMEERFWNRVDKNGPTPTGHHEYDGLGPCWTFTCPTISFPRAHELKKQRKKATMLCYRYSFELHFHPIPEGMVVRHKCDNGHRGVNCVNPDHLELGSQTDNIWDMRRRTVLPHQTVDQSMAKAAASILRSFPRLKIDLLAKAMNVRRGALSNAIKNTDPDQIAHRTNTQVSLEEVEATVALIMSGKSMDATALAVGRSPHTLSRGLALHGYDYEELRRKSGAVINDEHVEQAVAMARDGVPMNQISATLSFSYGTIYRAMHQRGHDYKALRLESGVAIDKADCERAVELARAGWSMNQISTKLGHSYGTVTRAMLLHGLPSYKEIRSQVKSPS